MDESSSLTPRSVSHQNYMALREEFPRGLNFGGLELKIDICLTFKEAGYHPAKAIAVLAKYYIMGYNKTMTQLLK